MLCRMYYNTVIFTVNLDIFALNIVKNAIYGLWREQDNFFTLYNLDFLYPLMVVEVN
jgi:hypothetical protein